jgi:hypothetical protein
MILQTGDVIEFELAPDGFNSRWNAGGVQDRGATGNWRRAKVTSIEQQEFGRSIVVAKTVAGDIYRFYLADVGYIRKYPMRGLRLIKRAEPDGKLRLVDRIDPVSKARYYATTDRLSRGDRIAQELFDSWAPRRN